MFLCLFLSIFNYYFFYSIYYYFYKLLISFLIKKLIIGEIGEIAIKGQSVIDNYFDHDAAEMKCKNFAGEFFLTGDLGHFDENGQLHLTGRSKEMINRAGEKISPMEVEEVLLCADGVKDAVVYGVPDEVYGERVNAAVVCSVKVGELGTERIIEIVFCIFLVKFSQI